MISLPSPVTYTRPSFKAHDGTIIPVYTKEYTEIAPVFEDSPEHKLVTARIFPFRKRLILWSGEAYDIIGDWTQDQADARILELLGDNPQEVLSGVM